MGDIKIDPAPTWADCESCKGKGVVACATCGGEGQFKDCWDHGSESHYTREADCSECGFNADSGEEYEPEECEECDGEGRVEL